MVFIGLLIVMGVGIYFAVRVPPAELLPPPCKLDEWSREYTILVLDPVEFARGHSQGLFAPIPMRHFEDSSEISWNKSVLEATMRGGVPHGFSHGIGGFIDGRSIGAGGIYFNMQLLNEAGLQWDLPYILQSQNNWTWETFQNAARRFSRDIGPGGMMCCPTAIASCPHDFLQRTLASNGAAFVEIDSETGLFVNATGTPEFLQSVEFAMQLHRELLVMHNTDMYGLYNAYPLAIQTFNESDAAMLSGGAYKAANEISVIDWRGFFINWGFVTFPRGLESENHYHWVSRDIYAIPYFFTEYEVDSIMYALRMRLSAHESTDYLKYDWHTQYPEPCPIDETIANFMRVPEFQIFPAHNMIPGFDEFIYDNFSSRIWAYTWRGGIDAQDIIDDALPQLIDMLDRANGYR